MSKKNDTDNHIEIEKRKSMLTDCVLCPRNCHADRINGRWGRCHETAEIVVARAALRSALYNVKINLGLIKDAAYVEQAAAKMQTLCRWSMRWQGFSASASAVAMS